MSTALPSNLPLYSEIQDPKASKNVRHVIRDAISNDQIFKDIAPYIVNGGKCGHKVMDIAASIDIIIAYDHANGNRLEAFKLNKKQLGDQFKNVLRERYELDKAWKITALSKRVTDQRASE